MKRAGVRLLSAVPGIALIHASLVYGFGGLDFYANGFYTTAAALLSLEVVSARLFENVELGVASRNRQSLLLLFGIVWPLMNAAMAWSAKTGVGAFVGSHPVLSSAGIASFLIGLSLRIWAARSLGRFFSQHVTVFAKHRIISTGPYGFCRHPAYAGTVIQLVGLTCIFRAYGCLAGLGIYLLAVWWRIEDEEKFLLRALPGEYSQYRAQVPSVLPRFRTSL